MVLEPGPRRKGELGLFSFKDLLLQAEGRAPRVLLSLVLMVFGGVKSDAAGV